MMEEREKETREMVDNLKTTLKRLDFTLLRDLVNPNTYRHLVGVVKSFST